VQRAIQLLFFPVLLPIAIAFVLAWQWRVWGLGLVLATLAATVMFAPLLAWRAIRRDQNSDSISLVGAYRLLLHPVFGITHAMGTRRAWVSILAIPFEASSTRAGLVLAALAAFGAAGLVSITWHLVLAAAAFIAMMGWTDVAVHELFYIFGFWLICDLVLGVTVLRQHMLSLRMRPIQWRKTRDSAGFQILHLSDLHFVADDVSSRVEAWGKDPRGNAGLIAAFDKYRDRMRTVDAVVLTGDITDAGRESEWTSFQHAWQHVPVEARERCFIVPGNHDLNVVVPAGQALQKVGDSALDARIGKEIRFAKYVDALQGDRCEVLPTIKLPDDVKLIPMRDWLRPHMPEILDLSGGSSAEPTQALAREISSRLFPYVWRTQTRDGKRIAFIGINTCGLSLGVGSNAYGIGGNSIRLRAALKHLVRAEYFPIVVGHHDVFAKTIPLGSAGDRRVKQRLLSSAMMFDNGAQFVGALESCAPSGFVYLHGHRHIARALSAHHSESLPLFCSAPSLLFGDESEATSQVRAALLYLSANTESNPRVKEACAVFV
jgi:hypothetical protein